MANKKRLTERLSDARVWLALVLLVATIPPAVAITIDKYRWWPWRSEHLALEEKVTEFETHADSEFRKRDLQLLQIRLQAAKIERRKLRSEKRRDGNTPEIAEDAEENRELIEVLKRSIEFIRFGR